MQMTNRSGPKVSIGQLDPVAAAGLRALVLRLHRQIEEERTRLARELHDDLAQKLTVVAFELASLKSALGTESPAAHQELAGKID